MGPIWGRQDPGGSHVGPMNLAIWDAFKYLTPIENQAVLTHWDRVMHICVSKLNIIGSDKGLSPGRRQAIIGTNTGILLIGPLATKFSENLIRIQKFSFKKMHLKMSSAKWCQFCLCLNVLMRRCNSMETIDLGRGVPMNYLIIPTMHQISHNALFCSRTVHTCVHFCYKNAALWDIGLLHCGNCATGIFLPLKEQAGRYSQCTGR